MQRGVKRRFGVLLAASIVALVLSSTAFAHAEVSPPVVLSKHTQVFTLAVPTEKEDAATTKVEITMPEGFSVDSFAPTPGWTRQAESSGSGEEHNVKSVVWSGGNVPHDEAAVFQFLGEPQGAKSYAFAVRQTYSDGSVVNWTGTEGSDTPAPTISARDSFGSSNKKLGFLAIALSLIAIVLGAIALFARSGRRPVT
jgi:uncharacterized protein YcnI